MDEHIRWTPRPPQDEGGTYIPIAVVDPRLPLRVICLSREMEGVMTHFWHDRTRPCVLTAGSTCPACTAGSPTRWKGYLFGYIPAISRIVLLQLTRATVRKTPLLLSAQDLRGYHVTLSRFGLSRNGQLSVDLVAPRGLVPSLPTIPNIRDSLERIWKGGD